MNNPTLTFTHLRFTMLAQTEVNLGGHLAGNNLHNALANVVRHATCPETHRREKPTPEHAAACPACYLFSAELDPGTVVRAYAVTPPIPARECVTAGSSFTMGITLMGDGQEFLPYFVLAMNEVGRVGVGRGRGKFALASIVAVNPLRGEAELVLAPDDNLVRVPGLVVSWADVETLAAAIAAALPQHNNQLTIHFLTPLRLEEKDNLFRIPDFGVFFRRLLFRTDELGRQLAGQERRGRDNLTHLNQLADRVRLVASQTRWHELWSWSGRKQGQTPLGGLVGTATYWSEKWDDLLPWLVFAQGLQVGKYASKGHGAYQIAAANISPYWTS
ncbi:MAG: CRISPR system precrRNA processing endoribonuclease RAMP protein Cas6 [Anaerolineae bacterium]|nr:CRISPR system precrRNA processing endoribonuclease RAMP protein Cas6 [Anaerolineae bacterium]